MLLIPNTLRTSRNSKLKSKPKSNKNILQIYRNRRLVVLEAINFVLYIQNLVIFLIVLIVAFVIYLVSDNLVYLVLFYVVWFNISSPTLLHITNLLLVA